MMLQIASLQFTSVESDDSGSVAVNFLAKRPLPFKAGQFGLWIVPGGGLKPFTVASAPEEEFITLGTSLKSQSRFKRALTKLTSGDKVRFIGPIGDFTLERTASAVVMLAQGVGVTPFRSILRHAAMGGSDKRTTLIHVGNQHAFRQDTEGAATEAHYPTSRELFAQKLEAAAREQPRATFMVSGTSAFVRSTAEQLKEHSVGSSQIMRDAFYGWSGY
jgi:glycine betaine catabolism B